MLDQEITQEGTNNPPPVTTSVLPTILYDADAVQRYGFNKTHKGRRYPVFYNFNPLPDETFVEYDRQRDVRMAADGQGGIDSKSKNLEAAIWLGREILQSVEGWGPSDGSKVSDSMIADAVQYGLLACAIDMTELPPGDAEADQPWEDEEETSNSYILRTLFNGQEIVCTHLLSDPNADQEKRWNHLMARTKLQPGEKVGRRDVQIPSRAKAIGKLYDEMKGSATGYQGRVPLFHKLEVMEAHMTVGQELAETEEKK